MTAFQALEAIVTDQLRRTIDSAQFCESSPPVSAGGVKTYFSDVHKQRHKNLVDRVGDIKQLALAAVQSAVAAQCHRVNAVAPVNMLREDNLVAIFAMLPSDSLFSASQACTFWRTLTLSAPSLWCSINLCPDPPPTFRSLELPLAHRFRQRIELMLIRSQNLHLDVKLDLCGDYLRDSEWDDEDRVDEVRLHAQRDLDLITDFFTDEVCRRLRFLAISYDHGIEVDESPLFLPPCPELVDVSLVWEDVPLTLLDIRVLGGASFEALRRVKFAGVVNGLNCLPVLSNVVWFAFDFPCRDEGTFTLDISDVLKAFPQLAELQVNGLWTSNRELAFTTTDDMPKSRPHPTLHTLILKGAHALDKIRALESSCPLKLRAIHFIAVRSCQIAAETEASSFLLNHLRPLAPATVAATTEAELFARSGSIWDGFQIHLYAKDDDGKGRSISSHGLIPGRLLPPIQIFPTLTLDLPFIAAFNFPTSLPNLTRLRMRINLRTSTEIYHKVSVPALREVQLYVMSEATSDPFGTLAIAQLFKRCFDDLVLPLHSFDVIGTRIPDADGGQVSSLAQRFTHGRRFDSVHDPFPKEMMEP